MPRLLITAWEAAPGRSLFRIKTEGMKLLMKAAPFGLKESKDCIDRVMEGGQSAVPVADPAQANALAARLRELGATVRIEADAANISIVDSGLPVGIEEGETEEEWEDEEDAEEEEAFRLRRDLVRRFSDSPEARSLGKEDPGGWADMVLTHGYDYLGVLPAEMAPAHIHEILFQIFPRKVASPPSVTPEVFAELRAFWRFLEREEGMENASACLDALDDGAEQRMEREMGNPANYGMAKSMFMKGRERGFDVETPEGIDQWMRTYNAELLAETRLPLLPPEDLLSPLRPPSGIGGKARAKAKTKRKIQEESRKRNRRKR